MNVGGTIVTSEIYELSGKKYWVLSKNVDLCGEPGALLERHGSIYVAPLREIFVTNALQQTQIMVASPIVAMNLFTSTAYSVAISGDPFGGVCASAVRIDK